LVGAIKIQNFLVLFFLLLFSRFTRLHFRRYLTVGGSLKFIRGVVIRSFRLKDNNNHLRILTAGQNTIGVGVIIQGSGTLFIGKKSFIGDCAVIGCNAKITTGRDVMIAQAVTIRDTDHNFECTEIPINRQGVTTEPITIRDDVWLGHGSIILKGVIMGVGAVVTAGALVNRDAPSFAIIGRVLAKIIGSHKHVTNNQV
jgi:acetyltransferase-like isoleucine patch superfamily enzyme